MILSLFAEGTLAGQLKVNVFKLGAFHTQDALAGQLMLKWVPASVVPGLCAQWAPCRTPEAEVVVSYGWSQGSLCRGHPGRMAETQVGVSWGVLEYMEGALVWAGIAKVVAGWSVPGYFVQGAIWEG